MWRCLGVIISSYLLLEVGELGGVHKDIEYFIFRTWGDVHNAIITKLPDNVKGWVAVGLKLFMVNLGNFHTTGLIECLVTSLSPLGIA